MDERRVDSCFLCPLDAGFGREVRHPLERADVFLAAVGIAAVVELVGAEKNVRGAELLGEREAEGEKDGVARRHVCDGNAACDLACAPALGHGDRVGERRAADRAEVERDDEMAVGGAERAGDALRGLKGKIQAVRFAREQGVPYLGICLGMQVAIVEYGRHVLGLGDANSTEFNRATPYPVIAMISEWQDQARGVQTRDEESSKGASMRLGAQEVRLGADTQA